MHGYYLFNFFKGNLKSFISPKTDIVTFKQIQGSKMNIRHTRKIV